MFITAEWDEYADEKRFFRAHIFYFFGHRDFAHAQMRFLFDGECIRYNKNERKMLLKKTEMKWNE